MGKKKRQRTDTEKELVYARKHDAVYSSDVGLTALCGIEFNATTVQVVPFLLLGLGVNDMFILLHAYGEYTREKRGAAAQELIATTLSRAGPAITLTTITNFVGLVVGADAFGRPIIIDFAWTAAIGVLFIHVLLLLV